MVDENFLTSVINRILDDEGYTTRDVKISQIAPDGTNYTTALCKITVTSPNREPLYLFSKTANISEKIRKESNFDHLFGSECAIYEKLLKAYDDIQTKHNVPSEQRVYFPKLYGKSLEELKETLVFEDLGKKGYVTYDRLIESLDWENASAIISTLAKLHALSFVVEKEQPELFSEMAKPNIYTIGLKGYMENCEKPAQETIQMLSEDCKAAVTKYLEKTEFKELINIFKPVKRTIIMHGDFRTSNIMYKKENGKLSVVPVDYQIAGCGSAASDIIYLITQNTNQQFRRQHMDELLDFYHDELAAALNRMGLDVEEEYPRSLFDYEYKKLLPYSLFLALIYIPGIFVDPNDVISMADDNLEASNRFMAVSPRAFIYMEKFIQDLMHWGAL